METQNKNNDNNNKKRNHENAIECSSKRTNKDKGAIDSSLIHFETMANRDKEKFRDLFTRVHEKSFDERMTVTEKLTFAEAATAYGTPYIDLPRDVKEACSQNSITPEAILMERKKAASTAVTEANKCHAENHSSSYVGEDDGSSDDDDDCGGCSIRNSGQSIAIPNSHSNFIKSLPYSPILEIMKTNQKICRCPCGKFTKPWKSFIGELDSFNDIEKDKICSEKRTADGLMDHLNNHPSALHRGVHSYLENMINKK